MKSAAAFACGVLFAVGLGISGMLQPARVVGFLDFFGAWDPTLLYVMVGAIPVYLLAWALRRGRPTPWGSAIPPKSSQALDSRLFVGAALFGVGWALAGVCPGPAVTNVAAPSAFTLSVLVSMLVGIGLGSRVPARAK